MTQQKPKIGTEIATTGDGMDITRSYGGAILQPGDPVLSMRSGGDVRIYEQILTDAKAGSAWQQRRLAVTSKEWEVTAGGDSAADKAAADWLRDQLKEIGWDRITDMMLAGVWYGYAVAELLYKRDGSYIAIDEVKVRNRRRFRFAPDGELRLLTRSEMYAGIPAPAPYFWHFATGADHDDEPYGLGLAHWLYWPVLFKRNGLKFWLIFLEKFGMPTAHGKFDETATDEDRQKLLQALEAIQTDSGVITPKSMEIGLLEAARTGAVDYGALQNEMNSLIAQVVLGQTGSSESTPGKLGDETLHTMVRQDLVKADADLICESFRRGPVRWLMGWNFPSAALPQVHRVIEEDEDLKVRSDRDKTLHDMGFRPSLQYVRDTYGGDWTEAPPTQAPGVQFSEPKRVQVDAVDGQIATLARSGDAVVEGWAAQIRAMVDQADSLEDLKARLVEAFDDLGEANMADVMGDALAAAHLAGRFDILEGL